MLGSTKSFPSLKVSDPRTTPEGGTILTSMLSMREFGIGGEVISPGHKATSGQAEFPAV